MLVAGCVIWTSKDLMHSYFCLPLNLEHDCTAEVIKECWKNATVIMALIALSIRLVITCAANQWYHHGAQSCQIRNWQQTDRKRSNCHNWKQHKRYEQLQVSELGVELSSGVAPWSYQLLFTLSSSNFSPSDTSIDWPIDWNNATNIESNLT